MFPGFPLKYIAVCLIDVIYMWRQIDLKQQYFIVFKGRIDYTPRMEDRLYALSKDTAQFPSPFKEMCISIGYVYSSTMPLLSCVVGPDYVFCTY